MVKTVYTSTFPYLEVNTHLLLQELCKTCSRQTIVCTVLVVLGAYAEDHCFSGGVTVHCSNSFYCSLCWYAFFILKPSSGTVIRVTLLGIVCTR